MKIKNVIYKKKTLPGQDRTWIHVVTREHFADCSTEANDTNTALRETYVARFELK